MSIFPNFKFLHSKLAGDTSKTQDKLFSTCCCTYQIVTQLYYKAPNFTKCKFYWWTIGLKKRNTEGNVIIISCNYSHHMCTTGWFKVSRLIVCCCCFYFKLKPKEMKTFVPNHVLLKNVWLVGCHIACYWHISENCRVVLISHIWPDKLVLFFFFYWWICGPNIKLWEEEVLCNCHGSE